MHLELTCILICVSTGLIGWMQKLRIRCEEFQLWIGKIYSAWKSQVNSCIDSVWWPLNNLHCTVQLNCRYCEYCVLPISIPGDLTHSHGMCWRHRNHEKIIWGWCANVLVDNTSICLSCELSRSKQIAEFEPLSTRKEVPVSSLNSKYRCILYLLVFWFFLNRNVILSNFYRRLRILPAWLDKLRQLD